MTKRRKTTRKPHPTLWFELKRGNIVRINSRLTGSSRNYLVVTDAKADGERNQFTVVLRDIETGKRKWNSLDGQMRVNVRR